MPTRPSAHWLDAQQAAALLGVTRATLYAYVSRGWLRALPTPGRRASLYRREDVARLAARTAHARQPRRIAEAALDWGLPVLASHLTLVEEGRLYYRGRCAATLAETATVEEIARWLWDGVPPGTANAWSTPRPRTAAGWSAHLRVLARLPAVERLLPGFVAAWPPRRENEPAPADLLRVMTAALLMTAPSTRPIHQQCQRAWQLERAAADTLRAALVLCADHEFNASAFTVRCIASTGASLEAAIAGGLAALSGPRHGGTTTRIEQLWDRLERAGSRDAMRRALKTTLARDGALPGFGHPLYPNGDPRAALLLRRLPSANVPAPWIAWIEWADALTGLRPSLDFALVAVRRSLRLPAGTAFGLFALGRTVGWIAHALEQRRQGTLIRPRAQYVGAMPHAVSPAQADATSGRIIRFGTRAKSDTGNTPGESCNQDSVP